MKTKIIPITVALMTLLFVFFRHEEQNITSPSLSEFFETGTHCNSVWSGFPLNQVASIGRKSENTCYATHFAERLVQTSLDEQSAYLSKTIDAFKEADRFTEGTIYLLMKAVMVNRSQRKNASLTPEEVLKLNLTTLDHFLTLAEACSTSRNNVIALIAESEKIIPEVKNGGADRTPSSEVDSLFSRYAMLKNRWIVHENELQAYRDRQFAHTVSTP